MGAGFAALLGPLELAASALSSPTIPAISNFLLDTMDKSSDLLAENIMQVNASAGAGWCLAWAKKPGDLAGVSIGIEGGNANRAGAGIGGALSWGVNLKKLELNKAWAVAFGTSVGVSAGINQSSGNAVGGFIAFAMPTNMPDWTLNDL
jgi:hypothetical protein